MNVKQFALSLAAATLLLTGCGSDDDNGTGAASSSAISSAASSETVSSAAFSSLSSATTSSQASSESAATSLLLNEFKANIPEDEHSKQYIELRGTPDAVISNTYLVVLDGDEDEVGHVDYVANLDGRQVGANGLIILKNGDEYNDVVPVETTIINDELIRTYDPDVDGEEYEDGILEHDAVTYLLISTTATISRGDDLDGDDDGTLELAEDAIILDAVANLDGDDGTVYTDVILTQSASDPDAATRFYDDLTPNSLSAWANGDIYEDPNKEDEELPDEVLYDTLQASANLPPKAALTPGAHNFRQAPFVLLNEIGNAGERYVELLSNASQSLDDLYLVAVPGAEGIVTTAVALDGQSAEETGITLIRDTAADIAVGSAITSIDADLSGLTSTAMSVALIYSPDHAIATGDDLDADDDGALELPDGAILLDNVGWGGTTYADILSSDDATAAIRYKDNKMVTLSAWSFDATLLTPAGTNIAEVAHQLVKPTLESARTTQSNADADDIAFWIHPTDPQNKSLVIATQKIAGYSIYDVEGNTLIDVKPEDIRYNNVDVMYGFELDGETVDLAIFTDRGTNKFTIFVISEAAPYLTEVTDYDNTEVLFEAESDDTAYGLAVYKSLTDGNFYTYASQNDHNLCAQFKLKANGDKVGWDKVRMITLTDDEDKHAEGMVVDQEYGKLYIAQEEVGVYAIDAEGSEDVELTEADMLLEEGDHDIVEDIEGMTIYYKDGGAGYLFISSQGNYTYGVYDRTAVGTMNNYLHSFAIVDDMNGIDGVQETDSIDVINLPFGSRFPHGVFIAQDGMDTTADPNDTATNFKWVKWEAIAEGLGDTTFDSAFDPRNPTDRRLSLGLIGAILDSNDVSSASYEMSKNVDTTTQARASGDGTFACVSSGTYALENWALTLTPFLITVDVVLDACDNGNGPANGTVNFEVSQLDSDIWQYAETFVTDFTSVSAQASIKIDASSSLSVRAEKESNDYETEATYTVTAASGNRERISKANSWIHHHTVSPVTWYPVSGGFEVDGLGFNVYDGYDASATPFLMADGVLQSGESWYLSDKGVLYKLAVTTPGHFTVSADHDGAAQTLDFVVIYEWDQQ